MSELKFCPECGASLIAGDKFCGDCGLNLGNIVASAPSVIPPVYTAGNQQAESPVRNYNLDSPSPIEPQLRAYEPAAPQQMSPLTGNYGQPANNIGGNLGSASGSNKGPLMVVVALLLVLFSVGGALYWWFSSHETGGQPNNVISSGGNNANVPVSEGASSQVDLSRAATYLGKPGMKYTFYVNYPDGNAAIVERIAAQAVPNEAVRVSEVELGMEHGEEYGFGFHYVERADGTYYILDSSPFEIFPLLKNNLTVGQTWNYQDTFGDITWTVLDMGVDLDLGFAKFKDCIIVKEENSAADWQTITYYAPGYGSVYVISPSGGLEYYKMTAMEAMDLGLAADFIKKWSPNYQDIKDDRSQSY